MTRYGVLWLVGMALFFVGERWMWDTAAHWPVTGVGLGLLIAGLAWRGAVMKEPDASRSMAQRDALIWGGVGASALLLYGLTLDPVTSALGFDEEAAARWNGSWRTLMAITWIVGAIPMLLIDLSLSENPISLPRNAVSRARISGLVTALAICLVFPVNYLAANHHYSYDAVYMRVTKPGESTLNLAATLPESVTIQLFYPAGNEVKNRIMPYFEEIEAASQGNLTVEVIDHALAQDLSTEYKLRDNGWVVFRTEDGEPQKFRLNTELDSAKRDFKKLDSLVQKHLVRVTRGERKVYFLVGHGEANPRTRDNKWRKLSRFKRQLQGQGYKVKDIGALDGTLSDIPEDAHVLVIAAPLRPLLEQEVASIERFYNRGGSLLVLMQPKSDPLPGVLGMLGLQQGQGPLVDLKNRIANQPLYVLLTDRFGSHPITSDVTTLRFMVLPQAVALEETKAKNIARTVLVRSHNTAFPDLNLNGKRDDGEKDTVHHIAFAVEKNRAGESSRAVVIGNLDMLADPAYELNWVPGQVLVRDALKWLTFDDKIIGEVVSEQDVKIQHLQDDQSYWFLGVLFVVPGLILLLGGGYTAMRRRRVA